MNDLFICIILYKEVCWECRIYGGNINQMIKIDLSGINKYYYINTACLIVHVVWMFLFLCENIYLLGILNVASSVIYLNLYYAIHRGYILRVAGVIYSEVLIHSIVALLCLGFGEEFELYILVLIPVMFFFSFVYSNGHKTYYFAGVLAAAVYFVLRIVMLFYKPKYALSNMGIELGIKVFNSFMAISVLVCITFITCKEVSQTRSKLEEKNRKLTFLSSHDPLTKLLNRRSMEAVIDRIEGAEEENLFDAVAFLDVDNFKKFNDQFGHDCGDMVLIKVAEIISDSIEETRNATQSKNYVCRWGGEEIIILFHDCDKDSVLHKVAQIKDRISLCQMSFGKESISVTVTCGVAFGSGDKDIRELINESDNYMLKGKKSGKNCIVISESYS